MTQTNVGTSQGTDNPYAKKPWISKYDKGIPAEMKFPEINLYKILDNAAEKYGSKTAIYFMENRISYKKVKEMTDKLATALVELGVKKGDRVALLMYNYPQFIVSFFGVLKAGAILAPLNIQNTESELLYQINDSGAEILIAADSLLDKINNIRNSTSLRHVIISNVFDYTPGGSKNPPEIAGCIQFLTLLENTKPNPPKFDTNAKEDVALLQYTGGTTGLPKAAMLTHYNVVSNAYVTSEWGKNLRRDGKETVLTQLPLFHMYGITVCMNAFILSGSCIALNPNPRDQKAFFEVVKATKPEWLPGVPKIYERLLDRDDFKDYVKYFRCVKVCNTGASAMPLQVMKDFEEQTGANIREGYGMTETSPTTISTPLQGVRKIGSVGVPVPNTEIKIVDVSDPTKIMPQGEAGELIVKGPQVMKGYWNKPKETLEQLKDGWLMTGDIVKMDKDGYIFIVDRKKEMINVSGEKVFAAEVENALLQFDPIANAAVIGVPNPKEPGNEVVKAFIILKEGVRESEETLAEIKDFCKKNMAYYKVPKIFEFKKEFPETTIGKTKKKDLKDSEALKRGEET